ncbi:MAG TPA: hypothetical protein VLW85_21345 [Myxococcales bacterium]|nr:hypothetical protein [Myxococcales bacterium]
MNPAAELALISFAVLFQELVLIRWVPSALRVLAYFPNVILLSAFLGLGIGCLRAGKRSLFALWPVSLLAITAAAIALSRVAFTQEAPTEHLWLLYADLGPNAPVVRDVRPPIVLAFLVGTLSFVAPGQLLAERLESFTRKGRPLTGYAWDLAGSLLGTAAFAAACFLWTRPLVWFSVVIAAMAVLAGRRWYALALGAATLVLVGWVAEHHQTWSPYYALEVVSRPQPQSGPPAVEVRANGSLHQVAMALGSTVPDGAMVEDVRNGYRIPYRRLGRKPGRVLVLGAGSGNDVAVALAEGAESVDAVEIDPAIASLGRRIHPDLPYNDPRVRLHVDDARSFLENTRERWDLIVFGTLDSMTRLSALSSVRLDNFVYTAECLRAARAHLTPQGGVALYFMVGAAHIHKRLLATLAASFDEPPQVVGQFHYLFNTIYLAGPAFAQPDAAQARSELAAAIGPEEPSTDDWPYLYLAHRGVTGFYISLIFIFALLAAAGVFAASPELRQGGPDLEMFLLGLGFLLLETRSVTEMTLVWGVTWLTSAVVFFSILLMALLGTLRPLPPRVSLACLSAALIVGYLTPTSLLLARSLPLRLLLSVGFVGLPVFFASMLFSALYATRAHAGVAFGWNLLGAVAGGLLEFSAMALGIKAMHLLALVAYLCTGLLRARRSEVLARAAPSA